MENNPAEEHIGASEPPVFGKLSEILTLAIYFEVIGVVYSVCFFGFFDLNFADYADIDDLLLGSFKEPIVFIAALAIVLSIVAKRSKKSSMKESIVMLTIPIVAAIIMAWLAHFYITSENRAMPLSNTGTNVRVDLAVSLKNVEDDRIIHSVRLLGTSGDYFFFFDKLTNQKGEKAISTIILPKSSITKLAAETVIE
ncbi:MAG: hypothetical protein GKR93_17970 [Gammaproteobacteria bacterium]|nr:hypothetical protein [Gammaproteobacteria bacterium]